MIFAIAVALAGAQASPSSVRQCGDTCLFLQRPTFDDLTNLNVPGGFAETFNPYVSCITNSVNKSGLSALSPESEIDAALQAGYKACARQRDAVCRAAANRIKSATS